MRRFSGERSPSIDFFSSFAKVSISPENTRGYSQAVQGKGLQNLHPPVRIRLPPLLPFIIHHPTLLTP